MTPAWVARVIGRWLHEQGIYRIWEPAPGDGRFADELTRQGFTVETTSEDFLLSTGRPREIDAIVTNPPYGANGRVAAAFARKALGFDGLTVALLLTVDFDSGRTRADMFVDCPRFLGKIVLLDRIVFHERPKASPATNHAWFLWGAPRRGRPTIRYGTSVGGLLA
jgi:hypothetical protein